ncbi:hypothetical protein UNSWDHB_1760 [Dehalobacter sp. UNSWDHB]|jgi:hypothetical protein|uniref:DUF5685 family protein n=1 Tax=unclassified Dehalobacter TaxID=2635733 RepID=UPI00028BA5C3|nr:MULTISPECIES: DUF5685 family protein [unclassified Dehalobacter]AFV06525.1 hypothetical protein DCF50_p2522 [Dehalobacter sp. CF]EQB20921.1 hypothetical protein UNSWDHB_1760 [Dehalobacter sp. UNSWDHB]
MFGYVVANIDKLTSEEKLHYRSCYCGLCQTLGDRHGTLSRITLNYDMTFLVLFLSALYQKDTTIQTGRCIMHPRKPHCYWQNEISDYTADMSIVLTYFKFLDDWKDERKILSLGEAKLFEKKYRQAAIRHPRQCAVISECLNTLSDIEKSGELKPDIPAGCFGRLMGEVFVFKEDDDAQDLRNFGESLGKFIYIMDACLDLKKDIQKECYNPLTALSTDHFPQILNLLMADCMEKYRQLPIKRDQNLIENILYSGVWTRYEAANKKVKGR